MGKGLAANTETYNVKLTLVNETVSLNGHVGRSNMPSEGEKDGNLEIKKKYLSLLNAFAEKYDNTYVLDLFNYAPEYNAQFKEKFYLRGHLNPAGYLLTAKMTAAYIDYIIRHNMKDFKEIGFIGTNLHE